ncbi:purine-binding chemotaxis protein CheW [Neorhizobium galegae]|uniref:chemotaxis protein CheW n=1 Tax=Neorhizobium galegae TaxID=399 RepID=UPI001AEAF099|nr:chemotaxis protein CheW [Neorhizobium galegae]MBP2547947.1 purine-binding chemotaxis protein CheW [Neorhizobium galegae]
MDGTSAEAGGQRRLVFQVSGQGHAIDAGRVLEVIRVPPVTRVPHGPAALLGIINLRGRPVPLLSMNRLLHGSDGTTGADARIIVYDHGGPVGLLVETVRQLSTDVTAEPLENLDLLVEAAFKVERRAPVKRSSGRQAGEDGQTRAALKTFLSFRVAGQRLGLPLACIREVLTFDGDVTVVPDAAEALIGVIRLRDSVLPLVALSVLMGLDRVTSDDERRHIVVVEYEATLVGLVVDEIDAIHRLPEQAIDPVPAVLQRGDGDARIDAIGRLAGDAGLMSILSPDKLFGHHAVADAVSRTAAEKPMEAVPQAERAAEPFLIFQLGTENYGVPVAAVDEVIGVPDEMTRIPGAPAFLMGVISLHGKAVPLIDQRTRFVTPASAASAKARALVATVGALQAGLVVDGVSEVKAIAADALWTAPGFAPDDTEVFDRIATMKDEGRMILLVDPQELLTRTEHDIVAAVAADNRVVVSP